MELKASSADNKEESELDRLAVQIARMTNTSCHSSTKRSYSQPANIFTISEIRAAKICELFQRFDVEFIYIFSLPYCWIFKD